MSQLSKIKQNIHEHKDKSCNPKNKTNSCVGVKKNEESRQTFDKNFCDLLKAIIIINNFNKKTNL